MTDTPQSMGEVEHPVVFTGNPHEYARTWHRHALLMIATLGLSFPWAMVNRFKYFYTHTRVGPYGFDYHAAPLPMFLGNVVSMVVLNLVYFAIGKTGSWAPYGVAAVQLLIAGLTPMILNGMARMHIEQTSWHGRRLGFDGHAISAYRLMGGPTLVYTVSMVLLVAAVIALKGCEPLLAAALWGACVLGLSFGLPWMYARFKRYQLMHTFWCDLRFDVAKAPARSDWAWRPHWRSQGLALALFGGVFVPVLAVWSWGFGVPVTCVNGTLPATAMSASAWTAFAFPLIWLAIGLIMSAPYPYLSVALQNELLQSAGQGRLRLHSQLDARLHVHLTARNWARVLCTFGWYYPYAAVSEMRARLEAITVTSRADLTL